MPPVRSSAVGMPLASLPPVPPDPPAAPSVPPCWWGSGCGFLRWWGVDWIGGLAVLGWLVVVGLLLIVAARINDTNARVRAIEAVLGAR